MIKWLAKLSSRRIDRPYFRIICPAMYGRNEGKNPLGPGSYWTPRWNAIQSMLQSIWAMYRRTGRTSRAGLDEGFQVKVYEIQDAIMENPPLEHSWAFFYPADAGEQVLVRGLSDPKLILDTHPANAEDFIQIAFQNYQPEVNYATGDKFMWQGKEVYVYPNYKSQTIDIAIKNQDGWSFSVIRRLHNLQEYKDFVTEAEDITPDEEATPALDYFLSDMNWINT